MKETDYEKILNIHTEGFQMGFPKLAQYHRYEPTPYKVLEQLFQEYKLLEDACCVDIGCGKGRVPIYLHDQFSIRTKGIELDQKFFVEAEQNLKQYKEKIRKNIVPIQFFYMAAEQYEIQKEDNVFFFFNPFSVNVFREVTNNLMTSYIKFPRTIHLIFYYPSPEYLQMIDRETMFEFKQEVKMPNEKNINERLLIFELKA